MNIEKKVEFQSDLQLTQVYSRILKNIINTELKLEIAINMHQMHKIIQNTA